MELSVAWLTFVKGLNSWHGVWFENNFSYQRGNAFQRKIKVRECNKHMKPYDVKLQVYFKQRVTWNYLQVSICNTAA